MVLHPSLVLTPASSWWSAKKVAPQLSAAQDCNEDVLRLIFALCTDSTLAAAARVCRTWTAPAQRELFSRVLRSYLRELRISCWKRIGGVEPFRWLRLLPNEGLVLLDAYGPNVIRACANGLQRLDLDVADEEYSDLSGIFAISQCSLISILRGAYPIETVITEASFPIDAAIAGFSAHTMLKEVSLGPHGRPAPHRPFQSLHEACTSFGIVLHTVPRSFSSERTFFRS
ncbi:hypothetical protein CPB85DRAFT_1349696 [Mucidula mucida]|nr:hypothetical protein CPB85DRAFT_1349696 [Mucidula mucida]